MKNKDKLIVSQADLVNSLDTELVFPFELSKEDLSIYPHIIQADNLVMYINSYPSNDENSFSVKVELEGDLIIKDDQDEYNFELETEDYLDISSTSGSDLPCEKGKYDFLPAVKAIFYNSIPQEEYVHKEYKDSEDYSFYTEEEYLEKKAQEEEKENTYRPFADLANLIDDDNEKDR